MLFDALPESIVPEAITMALGAELVLQSLLTYAVSEVSDNATLFAWMLYPQPTTEIPPALISLHECLVAEGLLPERVMSPVPVSTSFSVTVDLATDRPPALISLSVASSPLGPALVALAPPGVNESEASVVTVASTKVVAELLPVEYPDETTLFIARCPEPL